MRRPIWVTADLGFRADRRLGAAFGGAVRGHHRRRLERVGWLGALDAAPGGWAAGDGRRQRASRGGQEIDRGERLRVELRVLERAGTSLVGYVSRRPGHVSFRREQVLVLGLILALLGAGCGGGGRLGAKALSQQSKSLRSLAAEGALLAQDAVSGKTTRIYIREQSSGLYEAASQAETSLKAAKTEPALQPKLRQLTALVTQVRAALKRLGGASKDEQHVLGRELETAARESQKIGKGLK